MWWSVNWRKSRFISLSLFFLRSWVILSGSLVESHDALGVASVRKGTPSLSRQLRGGSPIFYHRLDHQNHGQPPPYTRQTSPPLE